jgi:hypothetical protein
LLELKGLEELNKYPSLAFSSQLVVELISVEIIEKGFSLLLLSACSLFRL